MYVCNCQTFISKEEEEEAGGEEEKKKKYQEEETNSRPLIRPVLTNILTMAYCRLRHVCVQGCA